MLNSAAGVILPPSKKTAAHQHQFLHPRRDIRRLLKSGGDIGECAERAERHRAFRLATKRFDNEIYRMLRLCGKCRLRQGRAV